MNEDGSLLDEAIDNLKEAARLARATQNRLSLVLSSDHPYYWDITYSVSSAGVTT